MSIQFTDRYTATGTPYPNPWTTCKGHCEGMGLYPEQFEAWERSGPRPPGLIPQKDESGRWEPFPPSDGFVWVRCPECGGTGGRYSGRVGELLDVLHTYYYPFHMAVFYIRGRFEDGTFWGSVRAAPSFFLAMWRDQRVQRFLLRRRREQRSPTA